MQLTEEHKKAIQQAKADAKNPAIKGKCVLFDGGMLGEVTDDKRSANA